MSRGSRLGLCALAFALGVLAAAAPARAQRQTAPDIPVLITADEVGYDQERGVVTARGNVEVSRENRVLLADQVTYNQRTKTVIATGNVSLTEPTGEVMFADRVEITDDLKDGVITNFRLLFPDETRVAATDARRTSGTRTEMNRVVFSPCKQCDEPDAPPLWQLKARKVVHNQETRDIEYFDASLEMFGVPVAYTPYLSHPDPTVKRRTGLLVPSYGSDSELGLLIKTPFFVELGPDKDLTVTPMFTTKERAGVAGQYRQRITDGLIDLDGSFTRVRRRDAKGNRVAGEQNRGHIFGKGDFDIDETWRWGVDGGWTTDDTYLRRYNISSTDVVTSTAFVEGFRGRNYASVRGYHFQGLRIDDVYANTPIVAPLVDYSVVSEPIDGWGRWSLDTNAMVLTRTQGTDSRRLSATGGWELPLLGATGDIYTFSAGVKADIYSVDDAAVGPGGTGAERFSGFIGRVFPHVQVDWRWPLVREIGNVRQLLEPRIGLIIAPNANNPGEIPNEDSTDFEFDDTNLFQANRFPGVDRVSGGQWLVYGLGTGFYGDKGGSSSAFVGQTVRLSVDDTFGSDSGLDRHVSDIVGRVKIDPGRYLKLNYRFRMNPRSFRMRRHELNSVVGPRALQFSADYLFFKNTSASNEFGDREEILASVRAQLTKRWSISARTRHDLTRNGGVLSNGVSIVYHCDCLTVRADFSRSFTRDRDIRATNRFFLELIFKHLGEVSGSL